MINVAVTLISPDVASNLYNIIVICTIHPDSTADQCVVMAMADGRVARTGMHVHIYLHMHSKHLDT